MTTLGFVSGVLVAVIAAGAAIWSARQNRRAAPYDAIADRVMVLEPLVPRVAALEAEVTELRSENQELRHRFEAQERAAREQSERFRSRIQVLLRHIAALTTYAEMLIDLLRQNRIPLVHLPEFPALPDGMDDDI